MNKEAYDVLTKTKEILSDKDSWSRFGLIQPKDFVTSLMMLRIHHLK